jgi:hypothetical protein
MWQNNISRINANEFQGIVQTSIQLNLSEYISRRSERENPSIENSQQTHIIRNISIMVMIVIRLQFLHKKENIKQQQ